MHDQQTHTPVWKPPQTHFHQEHLLDKPFVTALKVGLGFAVAAIVVVLAAFLLGLALISANSGGGSTDFPSSSLVCDDGSTPSTDGICADGTVAVPGG
jgi:hypothetical protein